MNKKDLFVSLVIGEISAWLIIILAKGLVPPDIYASYSGAILYGLPVFFPVICAISLSIAGLLSRKTPVIYQVAKFVLIGGLNTLVDWGGLTLAISVFRNLFAIDAKDTFLIILSLSVAYYSFFKALSFVAATISSFFWNKFWTFKRTTTERAGNEFLQFLIISFCGFLINVGIASGIFKLAAPPAGLNADQWAIVAAVAATAISMVWNFLGYKFIVFDARKA